MSKQDLEKRLAGLEEVGLPDDDGKAEAVQGEYLHEKWSAQCWEAFKNSKPTPDPPKALREHWKSPGYLSKPFNPVIRPQ